MFELDVAEGVHRLELASTNVYLVEDDAGVTVVDAGLPAMWGPFRDALRTIGRSLDEVRALVLTHGHFDHVGFARRLVQASDARVVAHADEAFLAAHPYRYQPGFPRLLFPLGHPGSWRHLAAMAGAGALGVRGVEVVESVTDGQRLDVPGRPVVVHTPGHTQGHCAVLLSDHRVLLTGDALVTLDPYTGRSGPRIVARAGTEKAQRAVASLDVIAGCDVDMILPGHGDPLRSSATDAARRARTGGVA